MIHTLRDIWRYRGLLRDLVVQDFRSRYAGSVIGVFWNILQPAAQVFIFAVILARIIGSRLPDSMQYDYGVVDAPFALSIYICAGLLPWIVISESIARTSTAFVAHSTLIKRVAFPHPLLVLYQVISGGITLGIMLLIFLGVMAVTGHQIGATMLWLPVIIVLQCGLTFGFGLILATITAHFRDMTQVIGIVLQIWFWMTPIVYPRDIVSQVFPGFGVTLLQLNPLYHLTNVYQNILFKHVVFYDFLPASFIPREDQFLLKIAVLTALALVVIGASLLFYDRLKNEIPDQI